MKRILLCLIAVMAVLSSYATPYFVTKDRLKYFADPDSKTASLVANNYSGDITVPEKFTDNDIEFTVTDFVDNCFKGCSSLTSIIIPSSVISLGKFCFEGCSSLISIIIPSSVTSLGDYCFEGCSRLTSIIIPSSVTSLDGCFEGCSRLTSITIPSSVTSLGKECFLGCSSLTSITIPTSVTSLGIDCFNGCSGLTSINIPSSVTSLGKECFLGCSSLTSITIPTSVTSLPFRCFSGCISMGSITIPSSVTSMGGYCFHGCSSLTSIIIPSSVTSLEYQCFLGCSNLTSITSKATTPPSASNAFWNFNTSTCLLYVPESSISAYKAADGWKDFKYIYKIPDGTETPETKHCSKPTINFVNGELLFSDETAEAKYHCTVTTPDVMADKLFEEGKVDFDAYYDISVYATADGYKVSDKATARLYWVKTDGKLDNPATSIAAKRMRGIVISSDDGFVRVSGLIENEPGSFYSLDGKLLGTVRAQDGTASLATSERVVLCKVGEKTIKVAIH